MLTALVTGSNRGIGLELVKQLKARGHHVIACCRSSSPALEATGAEVRTGLDVTSEEACSALAQQLAGRRLDLVIHNAGILVPDSLESFEVADIRRQFEVNALAPLRLTRALRPQLERGGKLAFITSRMGSLGDNSSGGYYGYRMSKAALNMAAVSLARDLAEHGVAVIILHPGLVSTDMTGGHGNIGPDEAARQLLERIDALRLEDSGHFLHANGEPLPW
jgi:NAD(P)-dependent dehydrogenase (short-subunit alcohol dehydrogenase family)